MAEDSEIRRLSTGNVVSETEGQLSQISREDAAFSSVHTGTRVQPDLRLGEDIVEGGAVATPTIAVAPADAAGAGEPVGPMSGTVSPAARPAEVDASATERLGNGSPPLTEPGLAGSGTLAFAAVTEPPQTLAPLPPVTVEEPIVTLAAGETAAVAVKPIGGIAPQFDAVSEDIPPAPAGETPTAPVSASDGTPPAPADESPSDQTGDTSGAGDEPGPAQADDEPEPSIQPPSEPTADAPVSPAQPLPGPTDEVPETPAAIPDAPLLALADAAGPEDSAIPLQIAAGSGDPSETLSVTVSNLPEGASLSAGTRNPDGSWTLAPEDLAGLALTPPADFSGAIDLAVAATTLDGTDSATATGTLAVTVAPVADAPLLALADAAGAEDSAIPLALGVALTDLSETLTVVMSNLPEGASLSAGTHNPDGSWTLAPGDLPGIRLIPPQDFSGRIELAVAATSADGAESATRTGTISVDVAPVADAPQILVEVERVPGGPDGSDGSGSSGPWSVPEASLILEQGLDRNENIRASGDEDVVVIAGDLAGGNNILLFKGDDLLELQGSLGKNVHVNGGQGADVLLLPKAIDAYSVHNYIENDGSIHLQLTDLESGGNLVVNHVEAIGFADGSVIGDADLMPVPDALYDLRIEVASGDSDGSETLGVSLSELPDGAVLSAGIQDATGTWHLDIGDLAGLQMRVPGTSPQSFTMHAEATSRETLDPGEISTASLDVIVTDGAGRAGAVEAAEDATPRISLEDLAAAQSAPQSAIEPDGAPETGFETLTLGDLAELVVAGSDLSPLGAGGIDVVEIDLGPFDLQGDLTVPPSVYDATV